MTKFRFKEINPTLSILTQYGVAIFYFLFVYEKQKICQRKIEDEARRFIITHEICTREMLFEGNSSI